MKLADPRLGREHPGRRLQEIAGQIDAPARAAGLRGQPHDLAGGVQGRGQLCRHDGGPLGGVGGPLHQPAPAVQERRGKRPQLLLNLRAGRHS